MPNKNFLIYVTRSTSLNLRFSQNFAKLGWLRVFWDILAYCLTKLSLMRFRKFWTTVWLSDLFDLYISIYFRSSKNMFPGIDPINAYFQEYITSIIQIASTIQGYLVLTTRASCSYISRHSRKAFEEVYPGYTSCTLEVMFGILAYHIGLPRFPQRDLKCKHQDYRVSFQISRNYFDFLRLS